jgi:hypothetical protein
MAREMPCVKKTLDWLSTDDLGADAICWLSLCIARESLSVTVGNVHAQWANLYRSVQSVCMRNVVRCQGILVRVRVVRVVALFVVCLRESEEQCARDER